MRACVTEWLPVVVEVTIKMVVDVPRDWSGGELAHNVEFFLNDGSRCTANELQALVARLDERGDACPCNQMQSKFLRVATDDDRTLYHYKERITS